MHPATTKCSCGGTIIRRGHEYFCSSCGLVYGTDFITCFSDVQRSFPSTSKNPVRLGSRWRGKYGSLYSSGEKRVARVLDYIRTYANGMPNPAIERAIYLARKHVKEVTGGNIEAFAIACLEKAAREFCLESVVKRVDNFFTRKRVRRYLREVLGNPTPDVRSRILREIRKLCARLGVSYNDCLAKFSQYEELLVGHRPNTVAATVVYCATNGRLSLKKVSCAANVRPDTLRSAVRKIRIYEGNWNQY